MKGLTELRTKLVALDADMRAILDVAVDDGERALTKDERVAYDEKETEYRSIEQTVTRLEAAEARKTSLADLATEPEPPTGIVDDPETRGAAGARVVKDREAAKGFVSLGEQLISIRRAHLPENAAVDKRLLHIHAEHRAATGLSEAVPSDGGFLLQADFNASIMERTYQLGQMLSRVTRQPIGPNANAYSQPVVDETSRADGSRWGGIRAYWLAEAAAKTASKPKFRLMELKLEGLAALVYSTDELLMDSTALGAFVARTLPLELQFKVEDAIYNGTGSGQPLGILNAGSVVSVAKESDQKAATVVFANVVKMYARAWAQGRSNSVWLINQDVEPQLMTLEDSSNAIFLPAGGVSGSPFNLLYGRPIVPIEYAATLGTVGDIMLADLSQYIMVDKGGIQSQSSIHVRFLNDETVFRFVLRTNGQPMWDTALTPFKGTNTQSPFITLDTRA